MASRLTTLAVDGFSRLSDVPKPGPAGTVYWMENLRFEEPGNAHSALVARGPFRSVGAVGTPSFGGSATSSGGVYEFQKLDGTSILVLISGGKFYTRTAGVLAESLTAAQLAAASVAISSTAIVYMTTFANQLVVTDGVNTPWMWDGTAGGGITKLTNAPVAYGPPAVYYAKLFFIKNTDRGTIVWSEEAAANTGYEAGGYNNAWTLSQTASEPLVAIGGTNEYLFYGRATGCGLIRGAVTSTFTSTGTHDAVSDSIGVAHPVSFAVVGDTIAFADQVGRPWLMRGGQLVDLAAGQFERTFGGQVSTPPFNVSEVYRGGSPYNGVIEAGYLPDRDALYFAMTPDTSSAPTFVLCFQRESGKCIETMRWEGSATAGVARLGSYQKRASNLEAGVAAITRAGYACLLYNLAAGGGVGPSDAFGAAAALVAYPIRVLPAPTAPSDGKAMFVDQIRVTSESSAVGGSFTGSVACTVDYLSSVAYTASLMAAAQTHTVSSGESGILVERQHPFGVAGYGRWILPRIVLTVTLTSGTLHRIAVRGYALDVASDPGPDAR